jgi:CheY-like chemotaxis protein
VKFTDAGVVETTLTARRLPSTEGAAPEWELQFTVRDTGPGIATDQQQRLFTPFTQGENASTRKHGGSGLGLAISRNLVQLMGGKIGLQSELGHGSAFTFTVRAPEMRAEAPAALVRLDRLRVVMEIGADGLGRELRRLAEAAGAAVTQAPLVGLAAADWDVALVDLDLTSATKLATLTQPRDGYPRDKLIGLVPLSLAPSLRPSLHVHFRQLVNKPVHHQTLLALMATPLAAAAPAVILPAPTHFKLTVLLVEDNAVNQRLMQLVLTKLGCQWDLASNGRLALEALARRDFDVVLMDLHMPEMDGPTAIAEIRRGGAGERMRGVWIIALTADAREDQRVRVLAGGANDYLTKPLKPNELADAFRRLLAAGARP